MKGVYPVFDWREAGLHTGRQIFCFYNYRILKIYTSIYGLSLSLGRLRVTMQIRLERQTTAGKEEGEFD